MPVTSLNSHFGADRFSRFWVVIVAAVVLAFCGVLAAMLYQMRTDTWDRAVTSEVNLLNAMSQDIARNVELYDLSLRAVAEGLAEPEFSGLSEHMQGLLLFDRAAQASDLGAILVTDRHGKVLRGSSPGVLGADLSDRTYFQALRADPGRGLYISAPFRRRVTGDDDVIALARALHAADGSFAGVVVGTLRLAYLRGLFGKADLGRNGAINLFMLDGTRIMRVPEAPGAIGRSLAGTANFELFRATQSGTFCSEAVVDGIRRVYSFLHVGELPLILVVAISEDEVLSPWRTKATVIVIVLGLLLAGTCVLAQQRARSEGQYRMLADSAIDVVVRMDQSMRRTYVSPSCRAVLGYEVAELLGGSPHEIVHPDDWPAVSAWVDDVRRGLAPGERLFRTRRKDGVYVWLEGRCRSVSRDGGCLTVMRDVSERMAAEERADALTAELARLANCDGLTGLANRRRFDEVLAEEGIRAARDGTPLSLLLIDVDRFKSFNDRYGHQEGDACLRRIADAIRTAVCGTGTLVARYGGEELTVVLPGLDAVAAVVQAEGARLAVECLGLPHDGNAGGIATVSVGCATAMSDDGLVALADARLYEAKRTGRNRVVAFEGTVVNAGPRPDEEARLATVARYDDLGGSGLPTGLDQLARLAAHLFGTPLAFVSLVGREDVRLIGRHGIEVRSAPREQVFCHRTIEGDTPLVVPDATLDPSFAALPMVQGGVRFYAGAPILDASNGRCLGALCIADVVPRASLDRRQRDVLVSLAGLVSEDLRRRLSVATLLPGGTAARDVA